MALDKDSLDKDTLELLYEVIDATSCFVSESPNFLSTDKRDELIEEALHNYWLSRVTVNYTELEKVSRHIPIQNDDVVVSYKNTWTEGENK